MLDGAGASINQPEIVARSDGGWALSYQRAAESGGEYAYAQVYQRLDEMLDALGSPLELFSYTASIIYEAAVAITSDGLNELVAFTTNLELRFAFIDEAGTSSEQGVLIRELWAGRPDVATNSRGHLVSFGSSIGLSAFPFSLDGTSSVGGASTPPGNYGHRIVPTESGFAVVNESVRDELRIHPIDDSGETAGTYVALVGGTDAFDVTTSSDGQIMVAVQVGDTIRLIRVDYRTLDVISSQSPPRSPGPTLLGVAAMGERFGVLTSEASSGALLEVFAATDDEVLGSIPAEGLDPDDVTLAGSPSRILIAGTDAGAPESLRMLVVECR
jgi:hypothetical protein